MPSPSPCPVPPRPELWGAPDRGAQASPEAPITRQTLLDPGLLRKSTLPTADAWLRPPTKSAGASGEDAPIAVGPRNLYRMPRVRACGRSPDPGTALNEGPLTSAPRHPGRTASKAGKGPRFPCSLCPHTDDTLQGPAPTLALPSLSCPAGGSRGPPGAQLKDREGPQARGGWTHGGGGGGAERDKPPGRSGELTLLLLEGAGCARGAPISCGEREGT